VAVNQRVAEFADIVRRDHAPLLHHGEAMRGTTNERDILLDQDDGQSEVPLSLITFSISSTIEGWMPIAITPPPMCQGTASRSRRSALFRTRKIPERIEPPKTHMRRRCYSTQKAKKPDGSSRILRAT
jgi:hypothetical protein